MTKWMRVGVALGLIDEHVSEQHVAGRPVDGPLVDAGGTAASNTRAPGASGHIALATNPPAAARSITLRPVAPKPQTIAPQSKDDLRRAVDLLGSGQCVIVDVAHVPAKLRHRMLDFLSGGCSAAAARMERVAANVFLLDPLPRERK